MATTVARLQAVLTADTRDFSRGMDKADKDVGRLGGSAKKGFGLVSKLALGAGAAIATGLGVTAKIGWDEMVQGQKVAAQTNAVLKSTGGVANVTAKQVARLSESIMKKTGIDDEAVASGQNLLLTFTKIRNETGKGNDIFTQSTRIMTDMSVALGQDMKSSAIQLGKALNDPIKGVTALQRVGVSFTAAQKDQIKALVDSGKTMDAQKLILRELNTEFGGSAEAAGKTLPGQLAILRESFNNWAGDMVSKAMPVLMDFVAWVQTKAVPAIRDFVAMMSEKLRPAFNAIRDTAAVVWPIVKQHITAVWSFVRNNLVPIIMRLWEVGVAAFRAIAKVLKENEPELKRILKAVWTLIDAVGQVLLWLATKIVIPILKPIFTTILPVALGFTIKALDLVAKAVIGVRNGFVWIKENAAVAIGTFWAKVQKPLNFVLDRFSDLKEFIEAVIGGFKWILDNAGKVAGKLNPFGDARDPTFMGFGFGVTPHAPVEGVSLMGANPEMLPFAQLGYSLGLHTTSGLRPGAITRSGNRSDHAVGKALDMADGPSQMAAFFRALIGNPRVKQAFYDPLGSIFGGAWNSYREGGHSDHVHVATYDKGGWLRPGWNLAYNGLGRPEPVGAMPDRLYLDLGDLGVVELVRKGKQRFEKLNGPGSW